MPNPLEISGFFATITQFGDIRNMVKIETVIFTLIFIPMPSQIHTFNES